MRNIGSISNAQLAELFADHLRASGVAVTVDKSEDGFRIWVHDDDRVPAAKAELPLFLADPGNERYRQASQRAMARIREDAARIKAARQNTVNVSDKWNRPTSQQCPVTLILIVLSVVSAYLIGFEPKMNQERISWIQISNDDTLLPILHGEVWRIVTPIFLHMSLMHLVFNLLCLREFGMQIEIRTQPFRFIAMIIIIAAISNFAQFWFHGHRFGGMSGVVYGLFGYIWIKGRFDPESGYWLPQQTILMMLVWHVLCVAGSFFGWQAGVISRVANWAHGGGLAAGMLIAFSETWLGPLVRRK